jgi:NAD(P)-dependent dehydrogenase (short-subunit alcohol dehydrogenase family)
MSEFVERKAHYVEAPVALVIGCGGLGTSVARALGRRHPLLICDLDRERLDRAIETLRQEGYAASGHRCDITDSAQTNLLREELARGPECVFWRTSPPLGCRSMIGA